MRKQSYVKTPNCIIVDDAMYSSTKRVLTAMLAYCSKKGTVRKSLEELAALSHCSTATVKRALAELGTRGIISKIRCFRFSDYLSRAVYAKNAYQINHSKLQGGYTLVPRELLAAPVSHSTFVVAMYIYMTAGRRGRSWASLRTAAKRVDLSKATICRAMEALRAAQIIVRYFCIMANHAHSCNSYYPTAWVRHRPDCVRDRQASFFSLEGGLNFIKHKVINKIAGDYILREREKGVGEFGDLYSFLDDLLCSGAYAPVHAMSTPMPF